MTESRIEKLTRIGQEMAAAVAEMRAEAVDLTPDLTTELANRQIEGEAAWWRSVDFDRNASRTFESMTGDSQQAVRTGVERVLAHLQSTGRLIPAGGMALTAEQVEDVRLLAQMCPWWSAEHVEQVQARVRSMLPATEPAEDAPCAICNVNETNHAGVSYYHPFTTELGPFDDDGNDRPAAAEPAEKETKAEGLQEELEDLTIVYEAAASVRDEAVSLSYWLAKQLGEHVDDAYDRGETLTDTVQRLIEHIRPNLGKTKTASSPVVPAPTETGLWQTWQEVPDCVKYKSSKSFSSAVWFNQDHNRYASTPDGERHLSSVDDGKMNSHLAPFVAAEEG